MSSAVWSCLDYYFYTLSKEGMIIYDRINAQIIDYARKQSSGSFRYDFRSDYSFEEYLYVFGSGVVAGEFSGSVLHGNESMLIEGNIYYTYTDEFTDPVDLRQLINGSSRPDPSSPILMAISEARGIRFPILDSWKTVFYSEAKINEDESIYQWKET